MEKRKVRRPLWRLLPILVLLPLAAGLGMAMMKFGTTGQELVSVAMKLAVIP